MTRGNRRCGFRNWLMPLRGLLAMAAVVTVATATAAAVLPMPEAAPVPVVAPAIELSATSVPAAGTHELRVKVAAAGRYAILAASRSGTALQLYDRMAGPGETAGSPGVSDGRLDLLLDGGEYKLALTGDAKARGEVAVSARAFTERHPGEALQLLENRLVSESLGDFEQASYWIEIAERRAISLEAAGRDLRDLRLWLDGSWLVDATPTEAALTPASGRPLRALRINTTLEPGFYLLTAYGGAPLPWAAENGEHPLHLRWGLPRLGSSGRARRVMGPMGIERFVLPSRTNVVTLELPEAEPARISVSDWNAADPYLVSGVNAEVSKKSIPPVARLELPDASGDRVLTVEMPAGRSYVLAHLDRRDHYRFEGSGRHWVSTVHTGHAEDSIGVTAIAVRTDVRKSKSPASRPEAFAASVVVLDGGRGLRRRFNLLGEVTLYLQVTEAGKYEIVSRGTSARFVVEPFLVTRPQNFADADFRAGVNTWDLPAGWFELRIAPDQQGIADIELRSATLPAKLGALVSGEPAIDPVRAAATFPAQMLEWGRHYDLYSNRLPGVDSGLVLRPLPLDLAEPLPLALQPGESVPAEFMTREAGIVRAEAEDGSALELSIDGGAAGKALRVEAGRHEALVRNGGDKTVVGSLWFLGDSLDPLRPLAPLPAGVRQPLPDFPVLSENAPHYLDVAKGEAKSLLVRAEKPGLYELATTGLLATEGTVRTRLQPTLFHSDSGGSGRNFRVASYLGVGDYQLTLRPRGESAGHLGVELRRTKLRDGGMLDNAVPARITLAAGEAVAYRFTIAKAGEHRIEALGLDRQFRARLEDHDGWPLVTPGGPASLRRHFEPGTYRLVLLPEAVESRRVTTVTRLRSPRKFEGHGPHALPLAYRAGNIWTEPGDGSAGGERVPDVWLFELPAPAEVVIALAGEMTGPLERSDAAGAWHEVARVPPVRGWKGRLAAGPHRLRIESARRNNRSRYTVEVTPRELLAGVERQVQAPAEVPIAIGADALVEIASSGGQDVRATLLDAAGVVVAVSDDRPDDWNFRISTVLRAGAYRLRVDPVAGNSGTTTVSLKLPKVVDGVPLLLPAARDLKLKNAAAAWPIESSTALNGLLVAGLRADEAAGVGIERRLGEVWSLVASAEGRAVRVAVPLVDAAAIDYRVRVWRLGRPGMSARLSVVLAAPTPVSEDALAAGVSLTQVVGLEPAAAVAVVDMERSGMMQFLDPPAGLSVSGRAGAVRPIEPGGLVLVANRRLWLLADSARRTPTLRGRRESLRVGEERRLLLEGRETGANEAQIDLGPVPDGSALLLEVVSLAGQPGVSFGLMGDARSKPGAAADLAPGPRRAIALAEGHTAKVARLWRADDQPGPLEVRVRLQAMARGSKEILSVDGHGSFGIARGRLVPGGSHTLSLPSGLKRTRLVLSPGVAAMTLSGESVRSAHVASGEAVVETVENDADHLTLLSTADVERPWEVTVQPMHAAAAERRGQSPWERIAAADGVARVRIDGGDCREGVARMRVDGATTEATLVHGNGLIERGREFYFSGEAALSLPHGPGPLLVSWLCLPPAGIDAQTSSAMDADAVWGTTPASAGLRPIEIERDSPAVLHMRSWRPAVARLERAGLPPAASIHGSGLALDAWLPAGRSRVWLRSPGNGDSGGEGSPVEPFEWTVEPVTELLSGLNPEMVLAAGGSRFFGFRVERPTTVGLGVQVLSGTVQCLLRDSAGAILGHGVAQMKELAAGSYLVELRAPAAGPVVRARAALVGLDAPGLGAPDEVARSYQSLGGLKSPGSAGFGRVTAPAAPLTARAFGPREFNEDDGMGDAPSEGDGEGWASTQSDGDGQEEAPGEDESGASEEGD